MAFWQRSGKRSGKHSARIAATLTSMLFVLLATLLVAPAAVASPTPKLAFDHHEVTAIEIHKFAQPDVPGAPATGLPQDTTGLTAVPGATFETTRVPGVDLSTPEGRAEAALLTVADVLPLIAGQPVAASATTDSDGNATLAPLGVGLYYVQETSAPAGFTSSAPFLVALPMAHPVLADEWLTTVHVYPKNARASITLSVIDQDAVAQGDVVRWASRSTVPNFSSLDGYRVVQRLDSWLQLTGAPAMATASIDCGGLPGCPALHAHTDYTATYDDSTRSLTVNLTDTGLRKLEQATGTNPNSQVVVDYETLVLADGELVNQAIVYPSRHTIEEGLGLSDVAVTKWGPLSALVHEQGSPQNVIAGVGFKLYLSEQDALDGVNPVTINGVSEWHTDAQGRLIIEGLRFSGFANGLDRDVSDPLYRRYWMLPTSTPAGWHWADQRPLAGSVSDSVTFQTLVFLLERDERQLPVTGAQMGGVGLLAVVLIAGGIVTFLNVRGRRSDDTETSHA